MKAHSSQATAPAHAAPMLTGAITRPRSRNLAPAFLLQDTTYAREPASAAPTTPITSWSSGTRYGEELPAAVVSPPLNQESSVTNATAASNRGSTTHFKTSNSEFSSPPTAGR